MARKKEFDPDAALDAAMELFWQKGYEAASMSDLVEHLGIGRASLYATFGSKHELYVRALQRYIQTRDPSPIEVLSQPGPVLPAVRALVRQYALEVAADTLRRGCMIVNAATEMLPGDEAVSRIVESSWDRIETALRSAFIRARAQGELGPEKDPERLASFILALLQGLKVLGRGSPRPARLQSAVDEALSVLD